MVYLSDPLIFAGATPLCKIHEPNGKTNYQPSYVLIIPIQSL